MRKAGARCRWAHAPALAALALGIAPLLGCAGIVAPAPPGGATYYVSASGDDAHAGTSPGAAWRTLAKVNGTTFRPGDAILLAGGETFAGGLRFDAADAGTAVAPVTVGSYGDGRATIAPGDGAALLVHNAGGFVVRDLDLVGSGAASNRAHGLSFLNDLDGDVRLGFVRIENVSASGFGQYGIAVGGWNGGSGYADVRIVHATAHGNARAGIGVYGERGHANREVHVAYCRAFDNPGVAGIARNSGNGIVLGNVDGGTIEHSIAYNNGWLSDAGEGPVGIWAYDSRNIVVQHNLSFRNRSGGPADGGGFALDGGVTGSVLQHNYSFGNDGAGYGLFQYRGAPPWGRNVVRYNVSHDDARKDGRGAITFWSAEGPLRDVAVHHNLVVMGPPPAGESHALLFVSPVEGLAFHDNTFVLTGGVKAMRDRSGRGMVAPPGNLYWALPCC